MALEKQYQRELDDDLQWLLAHVPDHNAPSIHSERADALQSLIEELIRTSRLPFTIGLFGGWGCGKTTFLGVLPRVCHNGRGNTTVQLSTSMPGNTLVSWRSSQP